MNRSGIFFSILKTGVFSGKPWTSFDRLDHLYIMKNLPCLMSVCPISCPSNRVKSNCPLYLSFWPSMFFYILLSFCPVVLMSVRSSSLLSFYPSVRSSFHPSLLMSFCSSVLLPFSRSSFCPSVLLTFYDLLSFFRSFFCPLFF